MTGKPYQRLIDLYRRHFMLGGGHSANDLIYLMVIAQEPQRAFRVRDFVQLFGHTDKGAWNVLKRLELTGFVAGGQLTERGRAELIDPPAQLF